MKRKYRLSGMGLLLLVTLVGLVGCTSADDQTSKAWVEITCDEFSANNHFSQGMEVRVGEEFEVKLCSNPTTGFKWSEDSQISDPTVLKQKNHEFVGPESEPPPPPGTPGQEIWIFETLKQGTTEIYFKYSRPWEGGEKSEWTFTMNVSVKESSASPPVKNEDEQRGTISLENTVWLLESFGEKGSAQDVIQGSRTTLELQSADNNITGYGGCNSYFGGYKTDMSNLTIEPPIASTEMACPEPEGILDQERQYLTILLTAQSYQIQDETLQINCDSHVLIYTTD
ncbi:protease inhibitor I42 family protein [Chloroflexota bacterium]